MPPIRVAVVGATGETGSSIMDGLIRDGGFSIVALTRPSSINKPANDVLKGRGVEILAADLAGPEDALIKLLKGIQIVISAIGPQDQHTQIPLASAAKKAGVQRFVPCGFITVAPPGGIMALRDWKEEVYNHIKQLYLPYTIIDVGWWYQTAHPRLLSGRLDYLSLPPLNNMVGDGNTPSALTNVFDIGTYVAAIVTDPRTLNKYVFAYNEVWTPNAVNNALSDISGEEIPRVYVTEEELRSQRAQAIKTLHESPTNYMAAMMKLGAEYFLSFGIRGDNTPEYARYLGYLDAKDLYPDLKFKGFKEYLRDIIDGKGKGIYQNKARP